MEGMRKIILAIDDNKDNIIVLKAIINDSFPNAEFLFADSGKAGLKLCRTMTPDLILLDIVMPDMDGYEVCRTVKEDQNLRIIPVVMLTANRANREGHIEALEAGADEFLS
jgi:CheY-like chemotaxis protein